MTETADSNSEHFVQLDDLCKSSDLSLLLELTHSANKTLIMATYSGAIAQLADRIVRMQDGQLQDEHLIHS